ncbi:F-box/LRR-repeat protein 3 [Frankliniella fusca]|uniref:F-box/LRR-repeat protein 3 n=1 Tax=Frankliniella fusca TaxID=407009 RepID=A0AAE1LRI1_9NEOP|nr:F-box/LRR-repeat protein 3 [Frankliniella fusca]
MRDTGAEDVAAGDGDVVHPGADKDRAQVEEDGAEEQHCSVAEALPEEVLLQVLALLPDEALRRGGAVRNVCRRWRRLSGCPSLWRCRRVRCASCARAADLDAFLGTVAVAPELDELELIVGPDDLPADTLDQILQGCARVRRARLALLDWRAGGAAAVVRHYSAFAETLELRVEQRGRRDGCLPGEYQRRLADIHQAVAASTTLRALRVTGRFPSTSPLTLGDLVRGCPSLEELDVERADNGAQLVAAITAIRPLRGLVLPYRHAVVDKAVLDQVAAACPGLRSLGTDYVDGAALLGHLPELRRLRLWFSYQRPDAGFLAALRAGGRGRWGEPAGVLARLEELRLEMDDDLELPLAVLGACSQLRALHLHGDWLPRQLAHLLRAAPASVTRLRLSGGDLQQLDAERALREALPLLPALRSVHAARSATAPPALLWERKRPATLLEPCYVS